MKWLGLTGGIATGKSTVSEHLRKSGFPVVDADVVAREVVDVGTPGFKKIVEVFGRTFVGPDGDLDRKKLGREVFADIEKRNRLEKIIHPLVQERVKNMREDLKNQGHKVAFYDVPLLYEKNLQDQFDAVLVVACSAPHQLERLMKRDGISKSDAAARIASQLPVMDKAAQADFVILNDGGPTDLEFEVREFLKKIQLKFGLTNPTSIRK